MSKNIKKSKLRIFLKDIWEEFTYNLGYCLGQLTPFRRFLLVLIFGGVFGAAYICILISAIYNIGKCDAEKEFLQLHHIETLKLQSEKESINIFNQQEYEYEQQSDK